MRVLAFDTSSLVSAVAVLDAGHVLAEDQSAEPGRHGELLLPRIAAQLAAARLELAAIELIAVGIGPGSFTGLRIGLATAKGLALATATPLCGVSSLRVLARGVSELRELVIAVVDAGRGELFGAAYQRDGDVLRTRMEPRRATPSALAQHLSELDLKGAGLCGAGARVYAATLRGALGADSLLAPEQHDIPSARHLADEAVLQLAQAGPSELATLEPTYLRDSDAKLPERPLRLG